jgi:hypothetical protein
MLYLIANKRCLLSGQASGEFREVVQGPMSNIPRNSVIAGALVAS